MKHPVALGCLLLGLAAVPDAMVMPVLHDLSVDRFGVSEGAAHGFMAVNIIGALAVIAILAIVNRRVKASTVMAIAAVTSAATLIAMAFATSWSMMLCFRLVEGGADLMLSVIPIRMVAASGRRDRYGGRMGFAFTIMFLALGAGVALGAVFGSIEPSSILWIGGGISVIILLIASIFRKTVDIVNEHSEKHRAGVRLVAKEWAGTGFSALDRLISALISVTLPLLLVSGFGIERSTLGIGMACMFVAIALFAAPAGFLADRIGGMKVRLMAVCTCGIALMGLGLMQWFPPEWVLAPCLLINGIGSAGLMPSSFSLCVRREASTLVFSTMQAAGQCGYAIGVVGGGILLATVSLPPETMFVRLFVMTGLIYLALNLLLLMGVKTIQRTLV